MPIHRRGDGADVPGEQRFPAALYRLGPNYCVDVPKRVSAALGGERRIEVVGRVRLAAEPGAAREARTATEGRVRSALVPRGGGLHRLFLDGAARNAAGATVGDRVQLVIRRDDEPRELPVPPELSRALDGVAGGREAFAEIPEATRASMLTFLEQAKGAETRARRVERIVEHVRERLAGRPTPAPARPQRPRR